MKKSIFITAAVISFFLFVIITAGCRKKDDTVKSTMGIFPDSVYNLAGINSGYDDYNSTLPATTVGETTPIIFSSNRKSSGGQFDLVQGSITYSYDKKSGSFTLSSSIANNALYGAVISKAVTSGNDFGPYSIYSISDGYNYFFISSQTSSNQLDIFYLKYLPQFGTTLPAISGPYPATVINTSGNDAYLSLDLSQDSAYFCSDRGGNFDIYVVKKTNSNPLDSWMNQSFSSASGIDSLNTSSDEKCPFVMKNIMVFVSNKPGGLGGFDIYYSVFKDGKWSSPVNPGPRINSSYDEYRPVLGYNADFSNLYLIFSSNKPGGTGGFDLYFTGFDNPK